jgi:MFS family permease
MVGFAVCYLALLLLQVFPSNAVLYVMVFAQGALGYGLTSVFAAIVAEIFHGRHYGTIFGTLMLAAIMGGAVGPWATGALFDAYGDYTIAFSIGVAVSVMSALAIWLAAPRKVRAVAGQIRRLPA